MEDTKENYFNLIASLRAHSYSARVLLLKASFVLSLLIEFFHSSLKVCNRRDLNCHGGRYD